MDILTGILGPIIGIVGGILTAKEKRKAQKDEYEFKLKEFEHEVNMRQAERVAAHEAHEDEMAANQQMTESTLAIKQVEGSYDGLKASIDHDKSIVTGPLMSNYRASVRPTLTYMGVFATMWLAIWANVPAIREGAGVTVYTTTSAMVLWWFGARDFGNKLNTKFFKA